MRTEAKRQFRSIEVQRSDDGDVDRGSVKMVAQRWDEQTVGKIKAASRGSRVSSGVDRHVTETEKP